MPRLGSNKFDSIRTDKKLTLKEEMSEMMFLGLRMIEGIPHRRFLSRFKFSPQNVYGKEIDELQKEGLVTMDIKALKLTLKGLFLANEVFKRFI